MRPSARTDSPRCCPDARRSRRVIEHGLHRRGDAASPFDDNREIAANIPDARFIPLEGRNHIFLDDEAEWGRYVSKIRSFLSEAA